MGRPIDLVVPLVGSRMVLFKCLRQFAYAAFHLSFFFFYGAARMIDNDNFPTVWKSCAGWIQRLSPGPHRRNHGVRLMSGSRHRTLSHILTPTVDHLLHLPQKFGRLGRYGLSRGTSLDAGWWLGVGLECDHSGGCGRSGKPLRSFWLSIATIKNNPRHHY